MKKLASLVAVFVAVAAVAFAAPVFADSPGQLANGPDLYQVRNVTQNGAYGSSVNTACNDVVKYSVKLANSEFGTLTNVTVQANLQTGAMTASATNAANQPTSVSGSVSVALPANASLSYIAGTTKVYDVNGAFLRDAADGVTAGGVNVGTLAGSTREFVQFQAKVNCQPQVQNIQVCELATKHIITIREDQFDATKHSRNLADCNTPGNITVCDLNTGKIVTIREDQYDAAKYSRDLNNAKCKSAVPATLVDTGAGDVFGLFAAVTVAGAMAYRLRLAIANRLS